MCHINTKSALLLLKEICSSWCASQSKIPKYKYLGFYIFLIHFKVFCRTPQLFITLVSKSFQARFWLPQQTIHFIKMESCAICFQEPEKLNICSLEPCHHEFCKDCVLKLRAQKCRLKCPLCRCNVESAKTVRYLLLFFWVCQLI